MCLLGQDTALGRRLTFEDLIPQFLMIPGPGATTFTRIRYIYSYGRCGYLNFVVFTKSNVRLMCF